MESEARFCLHCGTALEPKLRAGRLRPTCPRCDWVYFADPKVAVAALIEQHDKVLLVRRAIEPERGHWTLPAGFVDAGEDPAKAIVRECFEETGLQVNVLGVQEILSGREHKAGADILIVYRVEVLNGSLRAGDDVDAVAYFSREHLPPLAFGSTAVILQV